MGDMTDAQTDKTLQLRLENARLARAETALKAKGNSLEEALKALEARLAEHEEQALSQHAALEHDKHQARHAWHHTYAWTFVVKISSIDNNSLSLHNLGM